MDEAFDRLPFIQKDNINKYMFIEAYNCIIISKGDKDTLINIIKDKTRRNPKLASDLFRYCKLVHSIQ